MNESTSIAVRVIRNYSRELDGYIENEWIGSHIYQLIYQKLATETLIKLIRSNQSLDPMTIIENFRRDMDNYACVNDFTSRIYSIQADVATYILDEIIVIKERRRNQNGQHKIHKVH